METKMKFWQTMNNQKNKFEGFLTGYSKEEINKKAKKLKLKPYGQISNMK